MKPHYLEFAAFGPYRKKTTVDFEKLNAAGIFLISGPTGGGKTSILDAMCFALYCKATGGKRDFSSMRCSMAENDESTYVLFDFALGESIYRFRRECHMHKNRSTKLMEMRTEHECFKKSGNTFELIESGAENNIRKRAEELLHLTCEQFSQVIVLPQGDFLRFLRANSREKGEMLETLFDAGVWKEVSKRLSERQKRLEKDSEGLMTARKSLLDNEGMENFQALSEYLTETERTLSVYQKKKEKIRKELERKSEEYMLAQQFMTLMENRGKAKKDLDLKQEELTKKEELVKTVSENRPKAQAFTDKAAAELKQATVLKGIQSQLVQSNSLISQGKDMLKKAEKLRKSAEEIEKEKDKVLQRLKKGENYYKEVQQAVKVLPQMEKRSRELSDILKRFDELENLRGEVQKAQETVRANEERLKQQRVKAITFSDRLRHEEALINQNNAFHLADGLSDNEPCPVCGSTVHPHRATAAEGQLNTEDFAKLRLSERQEREKLVRMEAENSETLKQLSRGEEILEKRLLEYRDVSKMEPTPYQLEQESLIKEIAAKQKLVDQQDGAEKLFEELKNQRDEKEAELRTIKADIETYEKSAKSLIENGEKAINELGYSDEKLIAEEIEKSSVQRINFEEKAKKLLTEAQFAEDSLTKAKAFFASAQETLAKAQKDFAEFKSDWTPERLPDMAGLKEENNRLNDLSQEVSKKVGESEARFQSITVTKKKIEEIDKSFEEFQKINEKTSLLAKSLSGSNTFKMPILQYVLSIMLDEILAAANEFFAALSRGRYALERISDVQTSNGKKGLDIEVLDGNTGTRRPIETLSGGEQFLASLSLAFGLSDTVQSNSGAVRLESLFIDEGFGSLDSETLDTAMKALSMIWNSGRVVGIISHVAELKNHIKTKISISSDKLGNAVAVIKTEE